MITYKTLNDKDGQPIAVYRSDGWSIPFDSANTDYQAFLRWCEEGGVPEAADE